MTDRQITHAPGCWDWGPAHYECAVGKIKELQGDMLLPANAKVSGERSESAGLPG